MKEGKQHIPLDGGDVFYWPQWVPAAEALELFETFQRDLAGEQSKIRMFGKSVLIPRMNAWYADAGLTYTYSNKTFQPQPWTEALLEVRHRVETTTGHTFNSVLANLYRDGRDSNGWHSDDEHELGTNPVIASLSLGGERKFHLKHKRNPDAERVYLTLAPGSLLLMTGSTQHNWSHQVPKTAKPVAPRVNLTFRTIVTH